MALLSAQREANGLFPPPGWDQWWPTSTGYTLDDVEGTLFEESIFSLEADVLCRCHFFQVIIQAARQTATYKTYVAVHTFHVHQNQILLILPTGQEDSKAFESQYPTPAVGEELSSRVAISDGKLQVFCKSADASEGVVNWSVSVRRAYLDALDF